MRITHHKILISFKQQSSTPLANSQFTSFRKKNINEWNEKCFESDLEKSSSYAKKSPIESEMFSFPQIRFQKKVPTAWKVSRELLTNYGKCYDEFTGI